MKKINIGKSVCAIFLALALLLPSFPLALFVIAGTASPVVSIDNCGSRLVAKAENIDNLEYVWQISNDADSGFVNIQNSTERYYDISAFDEGKYIRVVIDGNESDSVGPIGKLVVFDLAKGNVNFSDTYSGFDSNGNQLSGNHISTNIYMVMQSNNTARTSNSVYFTGNLEGKPFDVTLAGVNIGINPNKNFKPNTSAKGDLKTGLIDIPASNNNIKQVVLRIKDKNIVRMIHYYTNTTTKSSLKITDINGDGETGGGKLYLPVEVSDKDIQTFIRSTDSYNHWNSCIGADDTNDSTGNVSGLHIAGGDIQALTTYGDNCTAIGAGGNGHCNMKITGGNIVAHCNGTGAAIGGGIGWNSAGGKSDITVTGGNIYAENHGKIYVKAVRDSSGKVTSSSIVDESAAYTDVVGGVAVGSGSSFFSSGTQGKVTVTGGTVVAFAAFGNGLGGGNSSSSIGGEATITISGGTVTANTIGGGNSESGVGGAATVEIKENANVIVTEGIGGGDSKTGTGGKATITVNGGMMTCGHTGIGGGDTKSEGGVGGEATITVNGGILDCEGGIGGGDSVAGTGGAAKVYINGGELNCGMVLGGGHGGLLGDGGEAYVNVTNGILTAQSIGGGNGGQSGHGGSAEIEISGGVIETGSIGGGSTLNPDGKIGYATAKISGGDISGQFLMAAGGTNHCSFEMTGGRLHEVDTSDTSKYNYSQKNGAAVYMDDPNGIAILSGGTIENCSSEQGGAVYMTAGTFTISGEGKIQNCTSTNNGGALYLGGGVLNVEGGAITANSAVNGGGVYLANGTMYVSGGEISSNIATGNGGGALVDGGDVIVKGGNVVNNIASENGGGIAVKNGNYTMVGGNVDNNKSLTSTGGGIYVEAVSSDVKVDILSGSVSGNTAKISGGAISVVGKYDSDEDIAVTVGVNHAHYDENGNPINCDHDILDNNGVLSCPVMQNNVAENSGGAIYLTGNNKTTLDIYCLIESGSTVTNGDGQSDFMKMEGGKARISSSNNYNEENQTVIYGNTEINNTSYITGGQIELWGEMTNPRISSVITVDVVDEQGYYEDNRINDEFYKLHYYENFISPETNIRTGQYKAMGIPIGSYETISGNIYNHPGYTIAGWNTDPDGKHNYPAGTMIDNPTWGWYDVGESYPFDGNPIEDLIIYAIWEAHGYLVVYDANIPAGVTYSGTMANQEFTYDLPIQLSLNQYSYPGYTFMGWNRMPDGSGESYTDGQTVTNLTTEEGEVVTLYAQWEKCDHNPETHQYTYSVSDDGKTLKRDCSCGNYSEKAMIYAENTVYDMQEHPAKITYSSDNWQPKVVYSKDGDDSYPNTAIPVNAGTYTASVSDGLKTASVTYIIEKADQPAPSKPKYEVFTNSDVISLLKVKAVDPSELKTLDSTYDSVAQYKIVYYVGATRYELDWVDASDNGDGFDAVFELNVALTSYHVYARFSECANYKASPAVRAESVYFFTGDVEIHVDCGEGIDYELVAADGGDDLENGVSLNVSAQLGYYIPEDYAVSITTREENGNKADLTEIIPLSEYLISNIPTSSIITITLPDAKKSASITGNITEKQIFAQVTADNATISRDSAFTAYFEITDYDVNVYSGIQLEFGRALPDGTTVILMDKLNGGYYRFVFGSDESTIDISEFIRMGSKDDSFKVAGDSFKLQFIVDFSKCEVKPSTEKLSVSLVAVASPLENANGSSARLSADLKVESTFQLEVVRDGTGVIINYTFNESEGIASIWDERHTALVLSPKTQLPSDAHILISNGDTTTIFYANAKGDFIVTLSSPADGSVNLRLISDTFPETLEQYGFGLKWMVGNSIAETSPMNGDVVAETEMTLEGISKTPVSVKITGDKNLYSTSESVNAAISWLNILDTNSVTVTLMRKSADGEYGSTGWESDIDITNGNNTHLSVTLAGQSPGSYCLQLTVMDGLVKVSEAKYYFIIQ